MSPKDFIDKNVENCKRKKINLPKFSKPNNYYDRRDDTKLRKSKEKNYFYSFSSFKKKGSSKNIGNSSLNNENNNEVNKECRSNSPSKITISRFNGRKLSDNFIEMNKKFC